MQTLAVIPDIFLTLSRDLQAANLSGANLWGVNVAGSNFANVKYSTNQILDQVINSRWILFLLRRIPLVRRWRNRERAEIPDFRGLDTTKLNGSTNPVLKRYIEDYQFILGLKEKGWFHKCIFYPLWKVTSDCGRSLFLWLMWSVLFAGFFAFLYAFHLDWFRQYHNADLGWFDVLYFSVITFTTLGFGDVTPNYGNHVAQAWVMAEVVICYIMLGGLISILANKLTRRA